MDRKEFDIKVRRLVEVRLNSGASRAEVGDHLQHIADEYREPDD